MTTPTQHAPPGSESPSGRADGRGPADDPTPAEDPGPRGAELAGSAAVSLVGAGLTVGTTAVSLVGAGLTVCTAAVSLVGAGLTVGSTPAAAAVTILALLPAAITDLHTRRLPNRLVAIAALAGLAAALAEWASTDRLDHVAPTDPLVGALAFGGPLLAVHLITPPAMGLGDVKAGTVLGAAAGFVDPAASFIAVGSAGALGSTAGLLLGRPTVAFGPPLVVGTALSVVLVTPLLAR